VTDETRPEAGSADRAVAAAAERAKQTAGRNIPTFEDIPVADTANLRKGADLNNALLALLPLVGVWRGEGEGRGPHRRHADPHRHGDAGGTESRRSFSFSAPEVDPGVGEGLRGGSAGKGRRAARKPRQFSFC